MTLTSASERTFSRRFNERGRGQARPQHPFAQQNIVVNGGSGLVARTRAHAQACSVHITNADALTTRCPSLQGRVGKAAVRSTRACTSRHCPSAAAHTAHRRLVTQSLTETLFLNIARIDDNRLHLTAVETQIAHTDAACGSHAMRPRRTCPQPQYRLKGPRDENIYSNRHRSRGDRRTGGCHPAGHGLVGCHAPVDRPKESPRPGLKPDEGLHAVGTQGRRRTRRGRKRLALHARMGTRPREHRRHRTRHLRLLRQQEDLPLPQLQRPEGPGEAPALRRDPGR